MNAEEIVLKHYLARSFSLIAQRWKTPWAEVDLVLETSEGIVVLVEVKTLKNPHYLEFRVTEKQKIRLRRVCHSLNARGRAVELHFAFVDPRGVVQIFKEGG